MQKIEKCRSQSIYIERKTVSKMSEYQNTDSLPDQASQPQPAVDNNEYTVIIDIGESTTKVGFVVEEPIMFPTIVGKPKYKNLMQDVAGVVKEVRIRYGD